MSYPEAVKALTGRPGYSSPITLESAETLAAWRTGSNGSGRRPYFVLKHEAAGQRTHGDRGGVTVRYASLAAAQKKADALNAADPSYVEYWRTKGSAGGTP